MRPYLIATALGLTLAGGVAIAQQVVPTNPGPPVVRPAPPRILGYLTDATAPDGFKILPPAPVEGTDRYAYDRKFFLGSRKLETTNPERWKLAQNDNAIATGDMLRHFSCSMGVTLTEQNAPKTANLMRRVARDSSRVNNGAKDQFKRKRPYLIDEGNTCIPKSESLSASFDYPSGHTQLGWMVGLVLAQIAPERSTQVILRGKAYGESRAVCGVHNASAIEGGRMAGSATFAAMQGSAEYQADIAAARAEIAALRAAGNAPDAGVCTAEAALVSARTPYY